MKKYLTNAKEGKTIFKKKELVVFINKILIPILCLSFVSAYISGLVLEKIKIFPEKYVCQSQLVIDPCINKDGDAEKSMDILKYNENYSLLIYSPSFLREVNSNLEKKYKNYLEIKAHLKVLYSENSQILTIQTVSQNKEEGINLSDTILKEVCEKSSEFFSYSKLLPLSHATVVEIINGSLTALILILSIVFVIIYGTLLAIYIYKKNKGLEKAQVNRRKRRKSNRYWNIYD